MTSLQLVSQVYKILVLHVKLKSFKVSCQVEHKLHEKLYQQKEMGKNKTKTIQETK